MSNAGQYLAVGGSVALLVLVLELIRRRRLNEEYSFIWILGSVGLIVLSVSRRFIDEVALSLGIFYGPALLLLMLGFLVAAAALHFSLVISRQRRQIDRLIEDVALLEAQQRRRKKGPISQNPSDTAGSSRRSVPSNGQ